MHMEPFVQPLSPLCMHQNFKTGK